MAQEGLEPNELVSKSSTIIPVAVPGGCGRIIKSKLSERDMENQELGGKDISGVINRCGDHLKDRMPGFYIACVECAGHLKED
jgi:hypothetical protein